MDSSPRPTTRITSIDETVEDGFAIITVKPSILIDETEIGQLKDKLLAYLADEHYRHLKLGIDLSNVNYFASTTLGALITFNNEAKKVQGKNYERPYLRPSSRMREVFEITKLDTMFQIADLYPFQ